MCDQGVQLVDAVLVLVPQPRQANPHPKWNTSHTLGPDCLVQSRVNSHIPSSHLGFSKLFDFLKYRKSLIKQLKALVPPQPTNLDSSWSSVLEPNTMETLVEVDGVLPGDDLPHGSCLLLANHLHFSETCSDIGNKKQNSPTMSK